MPAVAPFYVSVRYTGFGFLPISRNPELTHHAIVFMLKNVAMVHENAWMREPDTDCDFFPQVDENRIFKAAFLQRWCLPVSGYDLKLCTVHMEGVTAGLHHATAVSDNPDLTLIEINFFIKSIHN